MDPTTTETPAAPPGAVTIAGRDFAIRIPDDFGMAEDVCRAWAQHGEDPNQAHRVYAACIALGTSALAQQRIGAAQYPQHGYDVLRIGHAAYNVLRARGVPLEDVYRGGVAVVQSFAEKVAPRKAEVAERAGFSEPLAGG